MNKTQLVLLLACIGLSSFYIWSKKHHIEVQERDFEAKRYFPGQKENSIGSISVKCSDPVFDYTLKRIGDSWYLDGHLASLEKSPQLASSLIELDTEKVVQEKTTPESDKEYGLDKPSYTISLRDNGDSEIGAVILGDRTPGGNHYYGRRLTGGAIATVPAYTLSPLEIEPKDLRELSAFPVEVAAVDRFLFEVKENSQSFVRPAGKDDGFQFDGAQKKEADETKVKDLMFRLKDSKVARFLGDREDTTLGEPVAKFRAHQVGAKVDWVSEFCQPVAANPKLRYGRRFMTDVGKEQAIAGTEERFVIELGSNSSALEVNPSDFEDRRVAVLDVDKAQEISIERGSELLELERQPGGGWMVKKPQSREGEVFSGADSKVDKLLWALRDLRYQAVELKPESLSEGFWLIDIKTSDGDNYKYSLSRDKSGKSLVGFGGRYFLLEQELFSALDKAAAALTTKSELASPTPATAP